MKTAKDNRVQQIYKGKIIQPSEAMSMFGTEPPRKVWDVWEGEKYTSRMHEFRTLKEAKKFVDGIE
tara:strand:+ start:702 stop:899 length:198 start_codon:yes stop_codon:yes gene_type:complete